MKINVAVAPGYREDYQENAVQAVRDPRPFKGAGDA